MAEEAQSSVKGNRLPIATLMIIIIDVRKLTVSAKNTARNVNVQQALVEMK